jgi:hypothetical protein
MVSCGLPQRRTHPPRARNRGSSENPKENSSKLQPKCPRQPDQPSARRFLKLLAALFQRLPGLSHLTCRPRHLLRHPNPGIFSRPRSTRRIHSRIHTRASIGARLGLRTRRGVRRGRRIDSHHKRLSRRTSPDTKRTTELDPIHTGKCSRSLPARETLRAPNKHSPAFIASNPSKRIASTKESNQHNEGATQ